MIWFQMLISFGKFSYLNVWIVCVLAVFLWCTSRRFRHFYRTREVSIPWLKLLEKMEKFLLRKYDIMRTSNYKVCIKLILKTHKNKLIVLKHNATWIASLHPYRTYKTEICSGSIMYVDSKSQPNRLQYSQWAKNHSQTTSDDGRKIIILE